MYHEENEEEMRKKKNVYRARGENGKSKGDWHKYGTLVIVIMNILGANKKM